MTSFREQSLERIKNNKVLMLESRKRETDLIERFRSDLKVPTDLYQKKEFAFNLWADYLQKSEVVRSFRAPDYLECKSDEFLRDMYWPIIIKLRHEIEDEENRLLAQCRKYVEVGNDPR